MKQLIVALCATAMLGSAGTVLAKDHKQSICHNGTTYNESTGYEEDISFVITIAGRSIAKAVEKHVDNHGDLETYQELGEGEVCDQAGRSGRAVNCRVVTLCGPDNPS